MNTSQEQRAAGRIALQRGWSYMAVALGAIALSVAGQFVRWQSTVEFHTVLEAVAATLALVVAAAAPFRYYSQADAKYLFIGWDSSRRRCD